MAFASTTGQAFFRPSTTQSGWRQHRVGPSRIAISTFTVRYRRGHMFKTGNGSLVLTGSNTNTGRTTVVEGLLMVTGSGRLSDKSTVEVAVNGVLRLDGMTDAINGLSGYGRRSALTDVRRWSWAIASTTAKGLVTSSVEIEGTGGKLFKRGPGPFGSVSRIPTQEGRGSSRACWSSTTPRLCHGERRRGGVLGQPD